MNNRKELLELMSSSVLESELRHALKAGDEIKHRPESSMRGGLDTLEVLEVRSTSLKLRNISFPGSPHWFEYIENIAYKINQGTITSITREIKEAKEKEEENKPEPSNNQNIPHGMSKFNLERALAGDAVLTRSGKDASQVTMFANVSTIRCLMFAVEGIIYRSHSNGVFTENSQKSNLDLFMKRKTKEFLRVHDSCGNDVSYKFDTEIDDSEAESIKNDPDYQVFEYEVFVD
jgi:hypothetical protein